MSPSKNQESPQPTEAATLTAILVLMIEERESRAKDDSSAKKIEVLLAGAGLTADEIASVTGKKVDAVRKALQRAR